MNDTIIDGDDKPRKMPIPANFLNDESPIERGEKKRTEVTTWIYRWGYSSPGIINELSKAKAKGYSKKLVRRGLLIETKTESGIPPSIYTLSQIGLEEVERNAEILYRYPEIEPFRIKQDKIRHDLLAQTATLGAIAAGAIHDYETERMLGKPDRLGVKRPDVIWMLPTHNAKVAVEIELSQKWDRDLDIFVLGVINSLAKTETGEPARFSRFAIISDSPAIIKNYKKALEPGKKFHTWEKSERGHWVQAKELIVPEWVLGKCDFHLDKKAKK